MPDDFDPESFHVYTPTGERVKMVDGLCVRSELIPAYCAHCRGFGDFVPDGPPADYAAEVAADE